MFYVLVVETNVCKLVLVKMISFNLCNTQVIIGVWGSATKQRIIGGVINIHFMYLNISS